MNDPLFVEYTRRAQECERMGAVNAAQAWRNLRWNNGESIDDPRVFRAAQKARRALRSGKGGRR